MAWIRLYLGIWLLSSAPAAWAAERVLNLSLQEYPPYMGEHLPYQGIMSRIVVQAFLQAGITVQLQAVTNNRAIEGARRGIYDGSLGWARNPQREADLYYTDAVLPLRMVFCQRVEADIPWQALADLAPFTIGVTRGNFYSDGFDQLVREGRLHTDPANSDVDNLKKIAVGRIDLLPIDAEVGPYLLHTQTDSNTQKNVRCLDQAYWSVPLHVVLSRKLADGPQLVERFNRSLADMRRRGEFERLAEEARRQIYQTTP